MPDLTPGQRHRAKREEAGLSRPQLAVRSGVSLRTIARFELENRVPTYRLLTRLADALGTTPADLLSATRDAA